MKVVICGRMAYKDRIFRLGKELSVALFDVVIPQGARQPPVPENEQKDEFKYYYDEIKSADAIVVANWDKDNIFGYVGGNTLLEMGFAYVLGKTIVLLNEPSQTLPYYDEIQRMKPIVIDNPDIGTLVETLNGL